MAQPGWTARRRAEPAVRIRPHDLLQLLRAARDGNGTSVARAVLSADRQSLEQVQIIFRVQPTYDGTMHYGSRLAFGPDGKLYVTTGERSVTAMRKYAQQLDSHLGKVARIEPDGKVPKNNPFVAKPDALPEIWTLGHRNVQAAAFDAKGRLWVVEHGTRGGDELNLIVKGANHGWPVVAYGREYWGQPITGSVPDRPGYEQPSYPLGPVDRALGRAVLYGNRVSGLEGQPVRRGAQGATAGMAGDLGRSGARRRAPPGRSGPALRDVRQGPDGALYVVADESNGELWKVKP